MEIKFPRWETESVEPSELASRCTEWFGKYHETFRLLKGTNYEALGEAWPTIHEIAQCAIGTLKLTERVLMDEDVGKTISQTEWEFLNEQSQENALILVAVAWLMGRESTKGGQA